MGSGILKYLLLKTARGAAAALKTKPEAALELDIPAVLSPARCSCRLLCECSFRGLWRDHHLHPILEMKKLRAVNSRLPVSLRAETGDVLTGSLLPAEPQGEGRHLSNTPPTPHLELAGQPSARGSPFLAGLLGAVLCAECFVQMVSLSLDDNPRRLVLLTPRGSQGQRG